MINHAYPIISVLNYFFIGCWPVLMMLAIGITLIILFQFSVKFRNYFGLTFFALPGAILIFLSIVGLIYSGFEIREAIYKQSKLAHNLIQENETHLVQLLKNGDYLDASKILQNISEKGRLQGVRLHLVPTNTLAASFGQISDGANSEMVTIRSPDIDGTEIIWGSIKYQVNPSLIEKNVSTIASDWGRTMIWVSIAILLSAIATGLYFFKHLKRSSRFVSDLKEKIERATNADELVSGVESVEYTNAFLKEEIDLRNNLKLIAKELANLNVKWLQSESEAAVGRLATQVAHDIRSPLSVLNLALGGLKNIPEGIRNMITEAVKRIDGIANDLLGENKKIQQNSEKIENKAIQVEVQSPENFEVNLVSTIVEKIANEKRFEFSGRVNLKINCDIRDCASAYAKCENNQLSRILSNLVNNSVESLQEGSGEITLGVRTYPEQVFIILTDNGRGIPEHVLEKLGERGVTYGKENSNSGSGLGVYHAKKTVAEWGGVFQIRSRVGDGTAVEIRLPRADFQT